MSRICVLVCLALCGLSSCRSRDASDAPVVSTALKPIVTLVPIIDSSKPELNWRVGDELTAALDYRLSKNDRLFLCDLKKTCARMQTLASMGNPFRADYQWVKKAFSKDEFVVFLELIQHDEVLRQDKKNPVDPELCAADLNLSMRVRVFDVRGATPKVVLQEIVTDSHFIPRAFTHLNFHQESWEDESFSISPLGLAHDAFVKTLAKRIEDYILVSP